MQNRATISYVRANSCEGNRLNWQPPLSWKKQQTTPTPAAVTIDHYVAGASELIDLVTTGPVLTMPLQAPTTLEMYLEGKGWTEKVLRAPLAYVPPGFAFSSRWTTNIEWLSVHFDPSWLARSGLSNSGRTVPTSPHFDIVDDLLAQIVRSINEDSVAGMPLGPTYAETLGASALARTSYMESALQDKGYTHARAMRKAVEYIHDNFQDRLTLVTVAEAVGYAGDLYSFIRNFKRFNGRTPHQYIVEVRLQAGRDLIERGRSDVTQVALACSFSTTSHFSSAFRKRWGLSPSELKTGATMTTQEEAILSTNG